MSGRRLTGRKPVRATHCGAWPFVSSVAAVTPSGETVVVVVNEAKEDVKISLMNEQNKQILKVDIKERSIQTLVY